MVNIVVIGRVGFFKRRIGTMEIKITFSENTFLNGAINEGHVDDEGGELRFTSFAQAGEWIRSAAETCRPDVGGYDKTSMSISFEGTKELKFRMDLVHPDKGSNNVVAAVIGKLDFIGHTHLGLKALEDHIAFRTLVFEQIEEELSHLPYD
jgi:hypothetical protein